MFRRSAAVFLVVGGAAALRAASGCTDYTTDCHLNAECCPDGTMACFKLVSTGSSTSTGGGGGGGGAPAGCVPSESAEPVADSCGVFVSSSLGMDGNEAVKAAPAKTIGKAIEQAKSKGGRVYACAEEFAEAVTIAQGVTIYGGLDCAKVWAYVGATKKTALTAEADAIPLSVMSAASGTEIYDVAITAADAMKEGGSSIALLDDGAELLLMRVDLVAGAGKAGASGATQSKVVTPATAKGKDGADEMEGSAGSAAMGSQGEMEGRAAQPAVPPAVEVKVGEGAQVVPAAAARAATLSAWSSRVARFLIWPRRRSPTATEPRVASVEAWI